MKRTFFALLAVLLAGAGPSGYTIRYAPRSFADCNAAAAYANAHPKAGSYEYRISGRFVNATIARVPSLGYRGNARIRYSFVPGSTVMVLPRWSWAHMTASQSAGLSFFLRALRNHEVGHVQLAQRGIAGRESTVMVLADSQKAARARMAGVLAKQLQALYDEVLQTQKTYDRVTGHGVRQSDGPLYGFAGGEDVVFACR